MTGEPYHGLISRPQQTCSPHSTARADVVGWVIRDKYAIFQLRRINVLSLSTNNLSEMRRGHVFTVDNVEGIGNRQENDEEKSEACLIHLGEELRDSTIQCLMILE